MIPAPQRIQNLQALLAKVVAERRRNYRTEARKIQAAIQSIQSTQKEIS